MTSPQASERRPPPPPLSSLEAGQRLRGTYLARRHRELLTRQGSPYLTLEIADATSVVQARIWSPENVVPANFETPGVYWIEAKVETYRDELQVIVETVTETAVADEDWARLLPTSRWPASVLVDELKRHVRECLVSPPLLRLVDAVLADPTIEARLGVVPAATGNHHAYRGGLVEHTLSMCRLASVLAKHYDAYYPGLVREELLVAGALLHDLGKVWELEGDLDPNYGDQGRLVGHIPAMSSFIAEIAGRLGDIPKELVWELQHMVLSHHGEYEYGSPKRPKTAEAQALHYLDNLDARMSMFAQHQTPGWSPFHRALGRPLLQPTTLREAWATPEAKAEAPAHGPGLPRRSLLRAAAPPRRAERDRESNADSVAATLSLFDPPSDSTPSES